MAAAFTVRAIRAAASPAAAFNLRSLPANKIFAPYGVRSLGNSSGAIDLLSKQAAVTMQGKSCEAKDLPSKQSALPSEIKMNQHHPAFPSAYVTLEGHIITIEEAMADKRTIDELLQEMKEEVRSLRSFYRRSNIEMAVCSAGTPVLVFAVGFADKIFFN